MGWYIFPSVLALALKLWLLCVAYSSFQAKYKTLGLMVVFFSLTNAIELYGFSVTATGSIVALFLLKAFYIFLIMAALCLIKLTLQWCELSLTKAYEFIFWLLPLTLLIPIFSGVYIADYKLIAYSITRVSGPYYWVLQCLMWAILICAAASLAYWVTRRKSARSILLTVGMIPMFAVFALVLFAMQFEVEINASILVSCATTIVVLSMYYTESMATRTRIRICIPGTKERKQARDLIEAVLVDPVPLMEAKRLTRQTVIERTLTEHQGNKSAAARQLQVSSRSLRGRSH